MAKLELRTKTAMFNHPSLMPVVDSFEYALFPVNITISKLNAIRISSINRHSI